jgi:hypothetical protein
MSVRVMNMVFERYPNGGGEMLLALALADHAHDDGARIYPSVAQLAFKTRQSERAVQYQLRGMEKSGWLQLVNDGDGGRGKHREYRINPAWINGEELASIAEKVVGPQKDAIAAPFKNDANTAPFENSANLSPFIDARKGAKKDADPAPFLSQKGANGDTKGASHDKKGCKAFAPAYNHQEPSVEPSKDKARPLTTADLMADGLTEQTAIEWIAHRKRKKATLTVRAWEDIKAEASRAGWTVEQAVIKALSRGWTGFDAKWVQEDHRSQPSETAWQRSQRERAEQMTGGRASAKPPGRSTPIVNSTSKEACDAAIELG